MTELLDKRAPRVGRFIRHNIVSLTLLLCALAIFLGSWGIIQNGNATTEACKIQQRGLAADQHLARFFIYYDELLGLTEKTPKAKKELAQEPKAQRELTYKAIAEVNAFAHLQRQQPLKRSCP